MPINLRALALPLIRPFLPLLYRKRFKRLLRQIDQALASRPKVLLFFPAYHLGGAEKIHLEILRVLSDQNTVAFFCYKSASDALKKDFEDAASHFVDIHVLGNYPWFQRALTQHFIRRINEQEEPIAVLGCNVSWYYDIVDGIHNSRVQRFDLLHAFSPYILGTELRAVRSVANLDGRIVINQKTKNDIAEQYDQEGVAANELKKVHVIYNPLLTSCTPTIKSFSSPLRCLWVARGSKEKRPWLFITIAREALRRELPFQFEMVGDVHELIPMDAAAAVQLHGAIQDARQLAEIYKKCDFLLTTSIYEGFPLTIAEAICAGVVNISTAVGGIPEHVIDGQTGFLISDDPDEAKIVDGFIERLASIATDPSLLHELQIRAQDHIRSVFSAERFRQQYRALLLNE